MMKRIYLQIKFRLRASASFSLVARLAGKALLFFFLGIFIVEVLFDINPLRIFVAGSRFSISYYVYITLFDLAHFFWAGLLILGIGAVLFAFSKYRYIPIVLLLFGVAFYYEIVQSASLMQYYQMTYACHEVLSSQGSFVGYVCPLTNMIRGHPDIPLQGSVLAPIALLVSVGSYAMWRTQAGVKIALSEMVMFGSGIVAAFEVLIYEYQRPWFMKQVTDYQKIVYFGNTTNQELLTISLTMLLVFATLRVFLMYRNLEKKEEIATPLVQRQ